VRIEPLPVSSGLGPSRRHSDRFGLMPLVDGHEHQPIGSLTEIAIGRCPRRSGDGPGSRGGQERFQIGGFFVRCPDGMLRPDSVTRRAGHQLLVVAIQRLGGRQQGPKRDDQGRGDQERSKAIGRATPRWSPMT